MRKALVIGSIAAHAALGFGMFVSGIWKIEALDHTKTSVSLAVMLPPPAAPNGSPQGATTKITPKERKQVAKVLTQPQVVIDKSLAVAQADTTGNGKGDGKGDGDNKDGTDDDAGTCTGPDCGPAISKTVQPPEQPKVVLPPPAKPQILPPQLMNGLRTSGETGIVPDDNDKRSMLRDDHKRNVGSFKICIDTAGGVASVGAVSSTGYPGYDGKIVSTMRTWRYRPYAVNGVPTQACSVVTFVYTIN